jgi:RND superfamily putative drug exporter
MLVGTGLALGIDYSLFIVSRYREERARGREQLNAIAATGATASRAVFFSGIALVIALLGMVVVPDPLLRSIAIGAIVVAIVAMTAALTLLPAVLGLLGDRVNALRLPVVGKRAEAGTANEGRFWSWAAHTVMARPVASLTLALVLLLGAAAPVVSLKTGVIGFDAIPASYTSKRGAFALDRFFPAGRAEPATVVIDGPVETTPVKDAIQRLTDRLAKDKAYSQTNVTLNSDQRIATITAPLEVQFRSQAAEAAIKRLRSTYIPAAFQGVDADVLVTGETAEGVDYTDLTNRWRPIVFALVLGLSFVLLLLAFRSIVVPLKAIALNLLSVAAAYGLLVLVFQKGVGNELLGLTKVDAVDAWVPLFLFSVLFGLSMDYHVFLLSRIRERFEETGDNGLAVAHGISSTARLITGAALIIVMVFAGLALGDLVMFQQVGFGVAVALLLDATIVRCVLVPASMKLLGSRNWYLPSWLRWLPELSVEGPVVHRAPGPLEGARPRTTP